MSKTICIIPARYSSSRFPGKPLALINNKPMIQWVYDGVKETRGIDGTYVATDDTRIFDAVKKFGGNAIMTKVDHQSGTDRIAECVNYLGLNDDDIVLNIQGDEPLISSSIILDLLETLKNHDAPMGTLMEKISDDNDLTNENIVKVVTDCNGFALYFSRSPIPYIRNRIEGLTHYRHLGLYAYRVGFLKTFTAMPKSKLEAVEGLEQLRAIENGYKIKVIETQYKTVGVDVPGQIAEVEKALQERGIIYHE